jgi:ABC-type hemin transport system ATPase subunit
VRSFEAVGSSVANRPGVIEICWSVLKLACCVLSLAEVDPVEPLRGRADALAQRAAELKKLLDAWQPLYQSLSPEQKQRTRLLAARVLPQLTDAVLTTRMEMYDEDSDDN